MTPALKPPRLRRIGLPAAASPAALQMLRDVLGSAAAARAPNGAFELVLDCDDLPRRRDHLARIGVRFDELADAAQPPAPLHLERGDTGPCLLTLVPSDPADVATPGDTVLAAIEVRAHAPQRLAEHWSRLLQLPIERADGGPRIRLANVVLRFALAVDDQAQGVSGIELRSALPLRVLQQARHAELACEGASTFRLLETDFDVRPA